MKKHVLAFGLILFLYTQTKGQTSVYHPFPDSDAYWNQTDEFYYENGDDCYGGDVYSLFIKGDTIIGVNNYHKLFSSGYDYTYGYDCDGSYDWNNVYDGAIRQDTVQKELFIIQPGDSSEVLLYDFNLALGDTLTTSFILPNSKYVVSTIDSVLIGSNYRKRFWLDSNYVALIEGVGSSFGLKVDPVFDPATYELTCFNLCGSNSPKLCFDRNISRQYLVSLLRGILLDRAKHQIKLSFTMCWETSFMRIAVQVLPFWMLTSQQMQKGFIL